MPALIFELTNRGKPRGHRAIKFELLCTRTDVPQLELNMILTTAQVYVRKVIQGLCTFPVRKSLAILTVHLADFHQASLGHHWKPDGICLDLIQVCR